MKMALAVWDGRISPVFDSSKRLEVLLVEGERVASRQTHELTGDQPLDRAARLAELGVEILVCGAVSRPLAEMIAARGIRLIPFVAGGTEEVVAAFLSGGLPSPRLAMPGCCGRRMRHRGGAGGDGCRRTGTGRGRGMGRDQAGC